MSDRPTSPPDVAPVRPDLEALARAIMGNPHCTALGFELVRIEGRHLIARAPYRSDLVGDAANGVIAGGVVTTLLDNACGAAVALAQDVLRLSATIDLRIDYMRAATPGQDLIAEAECYRITRNVAFVRATAFQANRDDPVAHCVGAFMFTTPLGPAS